MAESPTEKGPEEYRGGVPEAADAKQGAGAIANEGIVPDSIQDSQPADDADPQAMNTEAHGEIPSKPEEEPEDRIDLSAGDNADATSYGHSGGAHGSEAGLGRHDEKEVEPGP